MQEALLTTEARLILETNSSKRRLLKLKTANANAKKLLARDDSSTNKELEAEKAKELNQNARILNAKGTEYDQRIQALSFAPPLNLDTLDDSQASINNLLASLKVKKDTLAAFKELPPDIHLANMMLAEKKLKLTELIQKKDKLLQSIM
ncbi:UNVERIFIED_CONTAM: hypothetical protein HDU68_011553, partial [Siphonaria sp. JEL0065]